MHSRGRYGTALVRHPGEGVDLVKFPGDFAPGIARIGAAEDLAVDAASQQKNGGGSAFHPRAAASSPLILSSGVVDADRRSRAASGWAGAIRPCSARNRLTACGGA